MKTVSIYLGIPIMVFGLPGAFAGLWKQGDWSCRVFSWC